MSGSRLLVAASLAALLLGGTGCLFRTRVVEVRTSTAKLQTATKQELLERINAEATQIKTLNATVDIATSVGGEKKGKSPTTKKFVATSWCANRICCA